VIDKSVLDAELRGLKMTAAAPEFDDGSAGVAGIDPQSDNMRQ
jgi:hypothetical protein